MEASIPDIQEIIRISHLGGEEILTVYGKEDFTVETKEDSSPLTEADQRANAVIVEQLEKLYPDIPILSEETKAADFSERSQWTRFWLVDPLDGTKEFIKRNGEFTVNIALIENGAPTLGVVYRPTTETTYYGTTNGGSFRTDADGTTTELKGGAHYRDLDTIRVVASRSHMSDAVKDLVAELEAEGKEVSFTAAGSSLKLCLVAEGSADIYPRLGPTMEWDTGAAHAVAIGAGRSVLNWETKEPLAYNKEDLLNPWFVVE